jgi:hypothetical protein
VLGHEDIVGNETADQLARMGSEHSFIGTEPACGISVGVSKKGVRDWTKRNLKKILEICNWTQAKGLILGPSANIKQIRIKMGGRTIYRTLSPKRTLFKTGVDL